MDELDKIPWKNLEHAYGSAADVPDLLRRLRTASPELEGEDSPLWELFGNIYHQESVYEATRYAVPFLIEIACDPNTPNRIGVLALLGAIAKGAKASYESARLTHEALAKGFHQLVPMAVGEASDIGIAAAHVLAQLSVQPDVVSGLLLYRLHEEKRPLYRAGVLHLLGTLGHQSAPAQEVFRVAAAGDERLQRLAAALALARLGTRPDTPAMTNAVMEAYRADDLEELFAELPWDVEVYRDDLPRVLDEPARDQLADLLIGDLESGKTEDVGPLVNLLFRRAAKGRPPALKWQELSARQSRAVQAMYAVMKEGRRIFYGSFSDWGLPDTMREWKALTAGRDPEPVDETMPLLARRDEPKKAVLGAALRVGDWVVHRTFGEGQVKRMSRNRDCATLVVQFTDEGEKTLCL